jgi:predicted enzyme related to lactoylglutathione lyase
MSKAIRFSLYYDNAERAVKFYSDVLGWKMSGGQNDHYWINAGPPEEQGLEGDLEKRVGQRTTVNHFTVKSFKDTVAKIKTNGGKIISETPMGDMGFHAFCEDSEGNVFAIFELKNMPKGPPSGGAGGPPPGK